LANKHDPSVTRRDRGYGREVAPGAVATHCDTIGVNPKACALSANEAEHGIAILYGRWEAVLWRETVVDGENRAPRFIGELTADRIMGVYITDAEAATMKEQQHRQSPQSS